MAFRGLVSSVLRRPLGATIPSPFAASTTAAATIEPISTTTSTRSYWQEVVRGTVDPRDGRNRYEDPENATQRSGRAQNAEGLLRRAGRYRRYEKPWMKKKRLANERAYRNQKRGVDELKMYIQFVQQNTPDKKKE